MHAGSGEGHLWRHDPYVHVAVTELGSLSCARMQTTQDRAERVTQHSPVPNRCNSAPFSLQRASSGDQNEAVARHLWYRSVRCR
jgi:hypothetical protein